MYKHQVKCVTDAIPEMGVKCKEMVLEMDGSSLTVAPPC